MVKVTELKNMVLTTFGMNGEGNVIWYPSFYDCDSELGLTNDGELRYGSGIDVATDNFNTSDSLLWTKLNEAFPDEIQDRYIYMRSNGFMTYENIIGYYERIADTIGQTFYNEDARIKYINEDNKGFIYMCNGSRLEHTKRWVTERIKYMDSCFNYGDWLLSSTIRSNITGEVSLYVKTYSPQWVEISFSDSATGTVRKWCDKDKFYEFTNEIENAVDNNITIRGINNVMYLQGLEGLNVSSMLISNATGLCEIDIHGSKRIQRLELGSNVMLQKLNCKDCSFLGYDDNYKVIDVSKCVNLKYIDLSGTKVGTLQLNENGGALEYLNLAESEITYLVCNHQEYLPAITLDGCANLSTVQVTQCNALTTITLPGSKIEDFRVTDCKKLDYINISNTSYLKTLDLTGCTGLRHLNMSGISSKSLTELDARSLSNLKILDISKCYYLRNIRFAKGFNTIQSINFRESGIETIQYGNDSVAEYLDLTPFSLSYIDFYHCSSLKRIKGLNVVSSSSPQMFNGCTSLERIDGYMKIKGNMNWTFAGCSKLSVFPTMDLSEVTWCHRTFEGCSKMTYNQMMTFLDSVPNCTGFVGTFWNCSGISYSGWKKALFDKMSKATELNEPFAGTNIRGQLESGLFDSLTELKTTYRLFAWNKVTGSIPANLFKYNTKLTSAQEMFRDNPNLSSATGITSMFQTTTELSNIYGLFWGCGNTLIRLDDKIFANCPNLTNMGRVFSGCSNLTGNISQHPNLVKGRSKLTNAEYTLHDCRGLTGDLPPDYFAGCTSLTNINGHFQNCSGITGELKTTIWANCPKLVHASALFAGCTGLGGYTGKTQEIPKDFFKGKNKLENISRMFSGCSSLQFKLIPEWDDEYDEQGTLIRKGDSSWFKDCTNLTNVSGLFSGCTNLYSSLPNRFFEILDSEGNSVDTKIVYASSVFSECDGLLNEIPPDLFKHLVRVTDLGGFFYHCHGLSGGVPRTLFENCYELSSIQSMFEYSSVSRYSYEITPESPYFIDEDVFWNCTKLSNVSHAFQWSAFKGEIPPLLFRTSIRLNNADCAFYGSTGFTGSLDSQLFSKCSVLENVEGAFQGCTGLNGELSSNIFTKKNNPRITNFKHTFDGCSNLEGYAPPLWTQYPGIDGEGCFAGCNKLGNIADVPTQWK